MWEDHFDLVDESLLSMVVLIYQFMAAPSLAALVSLPAVYLFFPMLIFAEKLFQKCPLGRNGLT